MLRSAPELWLKTIFSNFGKITVYLIHHNVVILLRYADITTFMLVAVHHIGFGMTP